jgi:hypothetical protein
MARPPQWSGRKEINMSILGKLAVGAVAVAAIVGSKALKGPVAKKARHVAAKAKKSVKEAKPAARSLAKKAGRATRKATTHHKSASSRA